MIYSVLVFTKDENFKSKYILSKYSKEYKPIMKRSSKGEIPLYKSDAYVKASSRRKPLYQLSVSDKVRVSGFFHPSLLNPDKGYGNFEQDALLIQLTSHEIKLIVVKDGKELESEYLDLWLDEDFVFLQELEEHEAKLEKAY